MKNVLFAAGLTAIMLGCSQSPSPMKTYTFDLQGHRGARGLLPENTIPSYLRAVELGVNTVELDLVVTKDSVLVASHEPWFNHEISTKPDGNPVTENEARALNIFELPAEEVFRYDVGLRGNPRFPEQEKIAASKPAFSDAVKTIEAFVSENGLSPVFYNIETKSQPDSYGVYTPGPEVFARLLLDQINILGIKDRAIVQSFDVNTLIAMRALDESVVLALLVENTDSVQANLDRLGFLPDIYSPYYMLLTKETVASLHEMGIKVIPWTVNDTETMQKLLEMGVDGIITDYPGRALPLRKK